MAYVDPVMTALQQGGSTANQSAQVASGFMNNASNAFNSAGSLSMKMIALLDQEQARKQQQLLQTTQVMHNIYQDNINTQLKQQSLQNQQESINNTKDYQKNLLDEKEREFNLSSENNALNNGGSYYDSNGNLKTIPFNQSNKYNLAVMNNEAKMELANRNRYNVSITTNPVTGLPEIIKTDKFTGQVTTEPLNGNSNQAQQAQTGSNNYNVPSSLDGNLSNVDNSLISVGQTLLNGQNNNENNKVEDLHTKAYTFFYQHGSKNARTDANKFLNVFKGNEAIQAMNAIQNGNTKAIYGMYGGDLYTFMDKVSPFLINTIQKTNPAMFQQIVSDIKSHIPQILRESEQTTHTMNSAKIAIKSVLKQKFPTTYNQLGFDSIINNKSTELMQNNNMYHQTTSEGDVQDLAGVSGNLFTSFPQRYVDLAIKQTGTNALTATSVSISNSKLSSMPWLSEFFHKDEGRKVINDTESKHMFLANTVNIKALDPTIAKAIEDVNNEVSGVYSKYMKKATDVSVYGVLGTILKNKFSGPDNKLNKKDKANIVTKIQHFKSLISKPKYMSLVHTVNNYLDNEISSLREQYPNYKAQQLYSMAYNSAIHKLGADKVKKAIIYNYLLLKANIYENYYK